VAQRRYDHEQWARQQSLEYEREQRAATAAEKAAERKRKQAAIAAGKEQAHELNVETAATVERLTSVLVCGLDRPSWLDLATLLRRDQPAPLDLGSRDRPDSRPVWEDYMPPPPGALSAVFGGRARHDRRVEEARAEFDDALAAYDRAETTRQRWVREARTRHRLALEKHTAGVAEHNQAIGALRAGLASRDRESVEAYVEMVLARTPLPHDVPHQAEVAYSPRGEQAVVRFELPPADVVPAIANYTFVGTSGGLREKKRPDAESRRLYRSIVSQIALLYMRDLLEADLELENVELGGHVHAINSATGQREYPCLISFAVDRERYQTLNLRDVTSEKCLTHLNALVSRHPHAVEPVTPVRDFDLARYSFVESVDVVAGLDSRSDLTKMTPTEFEHFVRQLFEARGLEGWTTDRVGDDGVDAVVVNRDPIVGGLTIVQAKKYTRVLGVNHIRELVGAMDEKRAGRGILVTTSWFASGCWTKATENGRVELIDGPRLRWLCQEHLDMDVLVAPPVGRATTWSPLHRRETVHAAESLCAAAARSRNVQTPSAPARIASYGLRAGQPA
jgi:restriction system protein